MNLSARAFCASLMATAMTVIMILSLAGLAYNGLRMARPDITLSEPQRARFYSDRDFAYWWQQRCVEATGNICEVALPDDENLSRIRDREYRSALRAQWQQAYEHVLRLSILLFLSFVVFLVQRRVLNNAAGETEEVIPPVANAPAARPSVQPAPNSGNANGAARRQPSL